MKISNRTLSIFKNYAQINSNFKADSGSLISTINSGQNLLAKATVEEEFPHPFAIFDMRDFLIAIGSVKDPDFEFGDKYVVISNDAGYTVKYVYAEPSTFKVSYPSGTQPGAKFSFDIDEDVLFRTINASAALSLPELYLKSNGTEVKIGAGDTQNKSANSFEVVVSKDSALPKFSIVLNPANLKLIQQKYRIGVCGRIITFTNIDGDNEIQYTTPSMANSIIEE